MQQVLSNLLISHIELRTEDSIDIKQYSFDRQVDKIVVPFSKELTEVRNRYIKVGMFYYLNYWNQSKGQKEGLRKGEGGGVGVKYCIDVLKRKSFLHVVEQQNYNLCISVLN